VPLYLGTAYALLNYILWFGGNLIAFAYLVKSYFAKPQLAIEDDGNNIPQITNRTRSNRISMGGKLFKKNRTKKSYKNKK
jgi:hypothetical protein